MEVILVKNAKTVPSDQATPPLIQAVINGDIKTVCNLLESQGDSLKSLCNYIDERDRYERTPLIWASTKGYLDIVKYLLEKGASINCEDISGYTAIYYASREGHVGIVEYLLNHGAYLGGPNKDSFTPIFVATICDRADVVKVLLKGGDTFKRTDDVGPFFIAIVRRNFQIVQILLEFGEGIDEESFEMKQSLEFCKHTSDRVDILNCLQDYLDKKNKLKEYFNLGIWINDFELFKFMPRQFQKQANILIQLEPIINLPIELFHELLVELWGQH